MEVIVMLLVTLLTGILLIFSLIQHLGKSWIVAWGEQCRLTKESERRSSLPTETHPTESFEELCKDFPARPTTAYDRRFARKD